MDSKIIKNQDFVLLINIPIINQNQTIINPSDLMVFDLDHSLIQLSNNIKQIRWDSWAQQLAQIQHHLSDQLVGEGISLLELTRDREWHMQN